MSRYFFRSKYLLLYADHDSNAQFEVMTGLCYLCIDHHRKFVSCPCINIDVTKIWILHKDSYDRVSILFYALLFIVGGVTGVTDNFTRQETTAFNGRQLLLWNKSGSN